MKILKKLAAAGMFAMLAIAPFQVDAAQYGFKVGAGTVSDVTTTACTTAKGQSIDMFGGGVSMNQVWALEREVGSKGSGVFEPVSGFTDIFPTTVGGAGTGGPTQVARTSSPSPNGDCYRLRMTTFTAGTGQVGVVTDRRTPTAFPGNATHYRIFDDFHTGIQPITVAHAGPSYLTFRGGDAQAIEPLIIGNPEGVLGMTSGNADDDTDMAVGSYGLITQGALVSTGLTVVEFRLHMSTLVNAVGVGLSDTIAAATEMEPFEADGSNVISEGTVTDCQNCAAFLAHDTDTNTFGWLAVSMNANTMGAVADEYTLGVAPVASTYQILRLEVDATGDAFWYINGELKGVEPLALATTAVVIPYYWTGSIAATAISLVLIDYIDFWAARPTS